MPEYTYSTGPSAMKAREKYAQVLYDATEQKNHSHRSNRVLTTTYPATSQHTNTVKRRTSSTSSQGSMPSAEVGRVRTFWKNILSPPAY